MKSVGHHAAARKKEQPPVPRGQARIDAIAAFEAEARARMLAAPDLFESLTPEDWERFRASDLPEILGSGGPLRKNSSE